MAAVAEAVPQDPVRRYSNFAVTMHWLIVVLILTQLWLGFTFADMPRGPEKMEYFTWHKTLGALILLLTLVRLGYRLKNPPPPFIPELPRWRQVAAAWNQWLFYALLILLPLTGLIAVSGRAKDWFTPLIGNIPLPVVPGIDEATGEISGGVHIILVWTTIALLVLHVAAALYQQFVEHDRTAGRMPPFQAPNGEKAVIGQGSESLPAKG
jgi:cytochrome b561